MPANMRNRQATKIVLITASNHRADCFAFEGRNISTPHLDRLARGGARFSACISPSHVGQPARASILTGQLPLTHGIADNGIDLSDALANAGFARQLSDAGYATALIGKAHFSTRNTFAPTGRPECRASGHLYPDQWHGPYAGFDHVELIQGHLSRQRKPLCPPDGLHYERWLATRGSAQEAHDLWATALPPTTSAAQTWHPALPPAWHSSTWVGDRAVEFLRAQQPKQPYLPLGILRRSAFPLRLSRAVEPAAYPGRNRSTSASKQRLRATTLVASGFAGKRTEA